MKFLNKIIHELLAQNPDLSDFNIVLPGKRPIVFIRQILEENNYSGFLPNFFTVEELIDRIADKQPVQGISLWLFAYDVYRNLGLIPKDDFADFLKWFPTLQKDWDDILKFSDSDEAVLQYMFDEERIKEWAQDLGEDDDVPRKKFLNFWQNMNIFLPVLKKKLQEKNWATSGMIHETAKAKIVDFAKNTSEHFVFCGFNAFTPVEEKLVRSLLQWNKAQCFFQADRYYFDDERQEAGKFLRNHKTWKEFDDTRAFHWIEDDFNQPKNIKVYEVSGNVTQTKVLPEIFKEIENKTYSNTAVVLLDENLLPASLDVMYGVDNLNITMGFPLKNLSFSNAVKQLFYLQKQLEKNKSSYYYRDIFPILEELPKSAEDELIISNFRTKIEERNIVYISRKLLEELLSGLSYYNLLKKADHTGVYLDMLISFCRDIKWLKIDDIQYENVSHFENAFRIIKNQLSPYHFEIKMETLEILINQHVNSESIDFQGEPLRGLQIMGLLETRLLNFENVIMLSVNEGKLPLGNSQNTYIPFDIRRYFDLHTFLENDSIYAYHFYRLIQDSRNVHLLYNALSSGVNTGEKSRFITQIEMESSHPIEHLIIENSSEPIASMPIEIPKTEIVMERLQKWKEKVSASHLTSYLYNPIDFYLSKILKTSETDEIEEELSVKNYGNLVHYSLQEVYEILKGKILKEKDLQNSIKDIDQYINVAIEKLKHQPEFYEKGMNFIHRAIAKKVIENVLRHDLELVRSGNTLEILDIEKRFENVDFYLDGNDKISFLGFIDRIDRLNGTLRIIDYKTAKIKNLTVKIDENNVTDYFHNSERKQALQLCIYHYVVQNLPEFWGLPIETGIWSFAEAKKGVVSLQFDKGTIDDAMMSVKNLILEILNPDLSFIENIKSYSN
ncbi:PD-(D/E)XK nuclease family protein [Chryseobacterium carnipullorum]|uniref:Inactivated superfamily I helicase n=1 Tax=Chryseobacterium carnipullorum TaxID=1124835 RepID=A0A376E2G8_CHRCU|nr:PD-(D/E)XK nuclease family protein [Chryseobacterium carnipullorum]AZA50469.1 PD-(D/E)XK nuclease family protein [Chryseobacterium carnipullorum]AZA65337.1 PD-(D/E)XK nuclease family protein [Chryseobacterium carnipullorum]MDN5477112.1 PD-(D/E)XK nuclease family protein [Chryseobacterium sp.]STC99749.1 Inactivated superfamily I helicase [Chryseobacterium carnipullorum]